MKHMIRLGVFGLTALLSGVTSQSTVQAALITDQQQTAEVATINQVGGTALLDAAGNVIRQLPYGSCWQVDQVATDSNGAHYLSLGGHQYISTAAATVTGTGFFTVAAQAMQDVITIDQHNAYTVNSAGQKVQTLPDGSQWRINAAAATADGETYYLIGADQYVAADLGTLQSAETQLTLTNNENDGIVTVTAADGAVLVNHNEQTLRTLPAGSQWQTKRIAVDGRGRIYDCLGGDQFVASSAVSIRYPAVYGIFTHAPVTANGVFTVTKENVFAVSRTGKPIQHLTSGSQWRVVGTAIAADSHVYYQISTDQYVAADEGQIVYD
ncbi:hypothetical protein IV38_GL000393 [Lactobacillus selangorensis]|uniref:S-layer protein C-terminal domain-containing protein n=1 Tax=Lactobacillus selangorensis TaxID=81857 RepID=A0A0R2G9N0_9LACO|nr:SLAP domain-containing protein [Lactobacillus selangorensis]KRN29508.1 hypothetical protein IV38_GL000393 [Lactobacillus selangorensis]KRN33962.1 hypothetical protein IV40_GL000275 [Lactobacillus selangorensis]